MGKTRRAFDGESDDLASQMAEEERRREEKEIAAYRAKLEANSPQAKAARREERARIIGEIESELAGHSDNYIAAEIEERLKKLGYHKE